MIVLCLEAAHGSGKTALINSFANAGFATLDEAFIDMPQYDIHPQSMVMESVWLSNWFTRLLTLKSQIENHENKIYIADRSPLSAVFYAANGYMLEPIIRNQIEELARLADIHIYTLHIHVDKDVLWTRICDRLKIEPFRKNFNEHSYEWMLKTYNWYHNQKWDFEIDNTPNTGTDAIMNELLTDNELNEEFAKSMTEISDGKTAFELLRSEAQGQK